jgi:membrane fusion protein (multidrug efflux system)
MKTNWLVAVLAAVICVPALATGVPAKPPAATAAKPAAAATRAATVRFVIQPPQEAQLAAQMPGKLLRFLFQEGASFRKGDRLVEFDCEERRAQLDRARASRGKAEKTEASQKQLRELKAISDLEYEIAKAELEEVAADVAIVQAQVNQCYINAPYNGRVVRRLANQHEHMTVGTPLMQIVESGTLKLEMLVPSVWLRWLVKGTEFSIRVDELNTSFKARVATLGARVDAASQTIDVRAEIIGATPGLLPGMSGTADFGVR